MGEGGGAPFIISLMACSHWTGNSSHIMGSKLKHLQLMRLFPLDGYKT